MKPFVFLLKTFQFFQLVRPHAAILFAPAVVGLLANLHLAVRVNPRLSLSCQHLDLAQPGVNLFGFMSFGTHYQSSQNYHNGWTNLVREDQKYSTKLVVRKRILCPPTVVEVLRGAAHFSKIFAAVNRSLRRYAAGDQYLDLVR